MLIISKLIQLAILGSLTKISFTDRLNAKETHSMHTENDHRHTPKMV